MIQNIYDQKEPENDESMEEAQKMKNSNENYSELKPKEKKCKNILISISFIILVIIIVYMIAYNIILKNNKTDKGIEDIQVKQDVQQNQNNGTAQTNQIINQIQNNDPNQSAKNDQESKNNEVSQTVQNVQHPQNNENNQATQEIKQSLNIETNQTIQKVLQAENNEVTLAIQEAQQNQNNETSHILQKIQLTQNNENNHEVQNTQQTQNNEKNQTLQKVQLTQINETNQTLQNVKQTQNNETNQTVQHAPINQNNETSQTVQSSQLVQKNGINQTNLNLTKNNITNQEFKNFGGNMKNISHKNITRKINSSHTKSVHKNYKKHRLPFYDFLPKINKGKDIKNVKDIFKSNRLYLNSRELTIEYIDFIKPIYPEKEEKYNKVLFPYLYFDNYSFNHTYNYSNLLSKLEKQKQIDLQKSLNKTNTINNHTINQNKTINVKTSNNNSIITQGNRNNNLINTTLNNSIGIKENSNNVSHNIRNMEELNQQMLKDFYTLCDYPKLITVKKSKKEFFDKPFISIIIPFFNPRLELIKTLRSIQLQTFKNLEIIIVDDTLYNVKSVYKNILESDYRIRLFSHPRNMGVWRKRIDGFLYSRGQYILHINPGDILADSYILKDLYDLVTKYNLDTVRFSFSKTRYFGNQEFKQNITFNKMMIYPKHHTIIKYGRPDYNVHIFGYGTIYNRLVRASVMRKGLDLLNKDLLNAFKDLWEDMWWNDLIDRVSFSNLVINRLGYIFLYDRAKAIEPRIRNKFLRNKTIREFIYFWYWDYSLLPKYDNKKSIINTLRIYSRDKSKFCNLPLNLNFLTRKFKIYETLLMLLIKDPFVEEEDKQFASLLYNNTMMMNLNNTKHLL